jgi:hypothetical protein
LSINEFTLPHGTGFDPGPVGHAVTAAPAGPGGVALVVNVFAGL